MRCASLHLARWSPICCATGPWTTARSCAALCSMGQSVSMGSRSRMLTQALRRRILRRVCGAQRYRSTSRQRTYPQLGRWYRRRQVGRASRVMSSGDTAIVAVGSRPSLASQLRIQQEGNPSQRPSSAGDGSVSAVTGTDDLQAGSRRCRRFPHSAGSRCSVRASHTLQVDGFVPRQWPPALQLARKCGESMSATLVAILPTGIMQVQS